MSSRDSFSQSDESLDALDGSKPSRVSKWRSSIRSGIKKSKKTTQRVTKSIKQVQDRAIETVQQRLPISTFGPQGRTNNWSSDDALNSFERPFESHSSSATANQKPFQFAEGVNLQSGWDSADEDGTGDVFEPPPLPSKNGQTKIVNTLIAENVKNSALLGQTVVTDLNENHDSLPSTPSTPRPASKLSGLDAGEIYRSVHSSIFSSSSTAEDFPAPPSLPASAPPPICDKHYGALPRRSRSSHPSPVPVPKIRSPPPPVPSRRLKSVNIPRVPSAEPVSDTGIIPDPNKPLNTEIEAPAQPSLPPPNLDLICLPDEAKTIDRRQFNTIDMRKTWTINHGYEEQFEQAVDLLDNVEDITETENENDNHSDSDKFSELPVRPEMERSTDSPYRSRILSRTDLQSIDNLGQSLDDLSFEACEVPVQRSQSCLSLSVVLREGDGPSRSRPDSFASIPNEHGRSIDSSHGSWDLETSEETLDDQSLDDYEKDDPRRNSAAPNITARLRNTFRSTLRDAAKVTKVKDMVRYVKRPHSAIEKTSYRDSRTFQPISSSEERRRSQPLVTAQSEWVFLPPPPSGSTENEIKRRFIVQSLIKTEKAYLSSLETLEVHYKQELLRMKPPIVDYSQVNQMFGCVGGILHHHTNFASALDAVVMEWDTKQSIGDIFVAAFEKQTVLESYSNFINQLPDILKLIQKLCTRKSFFEFCTKQQELQGDKLNLYGLMLKPVQRFPQFLLVLQDLLKETSFDHPDRVSLEGALTALDKLTEQLDQRSERLDQQQLFSKVVKISKSEWSDGETGRVIRSGPVTEVIENRGDDDSPVELREGVLILTDAGKLLFLLNSKKFSDVKKSKKKDDIDGCKIKWKIDAKNVAIGDFDRESVSERLGNRDDIQANLDKIDEIERIVGNINGEDTKSLFYEVTALREKMAKKLSLCGTTTQKTIAIHRAENDPFWKKYLRFSSAILAREWTDLIRGVRIRQFNQTIGETKHFSPWKIREEDVSTMGAERVLPYYLGSVRLQSDADESSDPDNVTFLSYSNTNSIDGSVILWYGTGDFLQVSNLMPEDDQIHENPFGRIFGRPLDKSIHSIGCSASVTCLFQAYSAIWCFQSDGDIFAFQDGAPFARLGVTRKFTQSPVVQILPHAAGQFIITTRSGSVCIVALSDSRGSHSFQLSMVSEVIPASPVPARLIDIPLRKEVWCWRNGKVSVIKNGFVESDFQCREFGSGPLSASVCINSGVWVSRRDMPTLFLYHVHTRTLLHIYDLSPSAFSVKPSHTFGVSSLGTIGNLLVAGTTSGIIIALPLPKLAVSKPSIVGPASASLFGPTAKVQVIETVVPCNLTSSESGLDKATSAGSNLRANMHNDAALLFVIGEGSRTSNISRPDDKQTTHMTIWRSAS